jgi:hypothetical protein
MNSIQQIIGRLAPGGVLLIAGLATQTALAVPTVNMTVSPLAGGIFQYQFSVSNSGPDDLAIVTIIDAPLADSLISSTLVHPTGFLASYDPGVGLTFGLVDFLEDTSPFQVGTTVSGFGFQSGAAPAAHFNSFEALSIEGEFFAGAVQRVSSTVPEGAPTLVLAGIAFLAMFVARSRLTLLSP